MEKTRKYCSRACSLEVQKPHNHRIISIEKMGVEDVFDMEVQTHHNFAVNDIIVHNCMTSRGIEKQNSIMVTSSLTGVFKTQVATRTELLSMIKG
jgi:GTP cyclohydrolase I